MKDETTLVVAVATHGATRLPSVDVDSYNVELKDDEGFVGDRASKGAFRAILENWRKSLRKAGADPLGDEPSEEISKKTLDAVLLKGDPEAAGVVQSAIEDFAQDLALVIRRFLKLKAWRDTERIVIGGGMRASRVGELAIGRAAVILKADKVMIDLVLIHHDPDAAGLIGAAHLAPGWMFEAHDAILAVDIGGTNIRAGVVELNLKKAADLSKASVWKSEFWRHREEKRLGREDAIDELVAMLKGMTLATDQSDHAA
jgi:sugar (pentulose or hexulose) kinase